MGRKVYIDLGANNGGTVSEFRKQNLGFIVFAFEPTPRLAEKLRRDFAGPESGVQVMECAAWIADGTIDFYLGTNSDVSSTVLTRKKTITEWEVDYAHAVKVPSLDFARWFKENTSDDDRIIIKMDIEGAEYKVLQRLVDTGLMRRITELRVEWHWDRYPDEVSREDHDRIRNRVRSLANLIDWG
jgi:FkbM family methyltransferase